MHQTTPPKTAFPFEPKSFECSSFRLRSFAAAIQRRDWREHRMEKPRGLSPVRPQISAMFCFANAALLSTCAPKMTCVLIVVFSLLLRPWAVRRPPRRRPKLTPASLSASALGHVWAKDSSVLKRLVTSR